MSIRLQYLREAWSFLSTFTGKVGEMVVDLTGNRVCVHDGTTPGGWPAAKLAEVVTNSRTAIADANYAALASDRTLAFTALTAARTVTLPAASVYPTGTRLTIVDESGSCSATETISVARAGSDTIDGATSAVISSAYGYLALQSNGASRWTIVDQAASNLAAVGIGTAADPTNPLSIYGANALFNSGSDIRVKLNKASASNTASFQFQDAFSGRAEIGLTGDDNFHFKVSPNGSSWNSGLIIDNATGAVTFGNGRTPISDTAYTALATDRLVAYTALTAARTVTLPAASAYPVGQCLTILDESGACSVSNTLTLSPAGTDAINGATSAVLASSNGYVAIASNGSNAWTIVDQQPRQILTGNRTYFVSPTGNDGNNGLSSGHAFLTIQAAINAVAALDLSIYSVTIQLADGTYTAGAVVNGPWVGSGTVTLNGDAATPDNVVLSTTGASQVILVENGGSLAVTNLKLTNTGSYLLKAALGGFLSFANLDFGACGSQQIRTSDNGRITATGNYSISAGAGNHVNSVGCCVVRIQSVTITLSGTPAFSTAFAQAQLGSVVLFDACTFSGSATGPRFSAIQNGVVYTNGAGASYLPGSSAGSTATGGQYV